MSRIGRLPIPVPAGVDVTIEGPKVTVKGPKGNYVTVKVKDPSTIEKLKLGDTAFIVYSESFALRLEKASATP